MEVATRRPPNEVRKERKRKVADEDAGAPAAEPAAGGPGAAPVARPAKRPRSAAQAERSLGKQRLVRTVALGNLTAACAASALALARSLGQARARAGRHEHAPAARTRSPRAACSASGRAAPTQPGRPAQVEEVVYPVPEDEAAKYMLHRDGCAGQLAFLVYDSVRAPRWPRLGTAAETMLRHPGRRVWLRRR